MGSSVRVLPFENLLLKTAASDVWQQPCRHSYLEELKKLHSLRDSVDVEVPVELLRYGLTFMQCRLVD